MNRWPTNGDLRELMQAIGTNTPEGPYRLPVETAKTLIREIEHLRALCAAAAEHVEHAPLQRELKDAAEGK